MKYPYKVRTCAASNVKQVLALEKDVIDYFNITTVYSGTLHYNVDGKDYILKKGDTLIIRPGSVRVRYPSDKPAYYFPIDYFSDGIEEQDLPDLIPNCNSAVKEAYSFIHSVHKTHSEFCDFKTSCAVHIYLKTLKEEVMNSRLNIHVQRILQYISNHFTKQIRIEDIAAHTFLTAPYCCHLVKKELGITISDIILRERIILAQDYLLSGEVPLKEIPFRCGFNDYSHFYKSFKKHTGISPSKFK